MKKNGIVELALIGVILILLGSVLYIRNQNNPPVEEQKQEEDPYLKLEQELKEEELCPFMKEIYLEKKPTTDQGMLYCQFEDHNGKTIYQVVIKGTNAVMPLETVQIDREELFQRILEKKKETN